MTKYQKIGLFDSGVGGLSVLRQLAFSSGSSMQFYYLGDTARCPYGNRSAGEIETFVREIVDFLTNYQLDAIIMACNTSAALAYDVAKVAASRVPSLALFDLIAPTADYIATQDFASLGIMATQGTVRSGAFQKALGERGYKGSVSAVACPLLVPIIESGRLAEEAVQEELKAALRPYIESLAGASAIVLGCTHFPFVAPFIQALIRDEYAALFPTAVQLIDPAVILRRDVLGLVADPNPASFDIASCQIFTTGPAESFKITAQALLGQTMPLPVVVPTGDLVVMQIKDGSTALAY